MKKILPLLLFSVIFSFFLTVFSPLAFAQPAPTATPTVAPTSAPIQLGTTGPTPVDGDGWTGPDPEVTFVGKTGARSGQFLDWALQNYQWLTLVDGKNPLIPFWITIRNIVYAVIALFVLATAFILIVTRGQNITIMRFIPRFVFVIILITLSFSIVQFIYQICDIVQDFFLKVNGKYISTQDLLYIGFDYESFLGFRRSGPEFDESAFISLLLVRLTAITYYVMTGILLVRKIILWFFIILSPVFPLLLFYKPIRNTAKIWVGEFFRWLLYAPLFAIFLHGLVVMWTTGIPLPFDFTGVAAGKVVYPTAINILLGGPGQTLGLNNSVNLRDTFALYVVALLMLWVVILLPFLLLKIFLDYINTISLENNMFMKRVVTRGAEFLQGPRGVPPTPQTPPPGLTQPAGVARTLPFFAKKAAVEPVQSRATIQASVQESANILNLANLSIPKMRDIARYEASMMSKDTTRQSEVSNFHTTLEKIANPSIVSTPAEREKFTTVRQKLIEQQQKGNPIASSVINATKLSTTSIQNVAEVRQKNLAHLTLVLKRIENPELAIIPAEKDKYAKLKEKLVDKKQKGDQLASEILETGQKTANTNVPTEEKQKAQETLLEKLLAEEKKGNQEVKEFVAEGPTAPKTKENLPVVNKVQQVSLEDYEEVRKLWTENYQKLEPPKGLDGQDIDRREWIRNDIDKVNQAIALMTSQDPQKVNEGMEMVSNILPFLMMGGFSKSEVVAYLKAKMEAGKQVLSDIQKKEEEEEGMIDRQTTAQAQKSQTTARELGPEDENPAVAGGGPKPLEDLENDANKQN